MSKRQITENEFTKLVETTSAWFSRIERRLEHLEMGPAEKACRKFEEAAFDCNRLHTLGRRRWNLAERLEYIRLQLNEIHEEGNEEEEWNNIRGMSAIHFVSEYMDEYNPKGWAAIDEERADEDRQESVVDFDELFDKTLGHPDNEERADKILEEIRRKRKKSLEQK